MAVQLKRRRFTADEYQWMGRVGILREDDRVELLEGEIVEMAPTGSEHNASVDDVNLLFVHRFSDVARVRVQGSIRLDRHNEPEPDLVLLKPRADGYRSSMAGPDDVLLIVEVADSSLEMDRRVKLPLYANAGICEVWLLDLRHELIEVHREPASDGYRVVTTLRRGDKLAPLAFPDRELEVAELLA